MALSSCLILRYVATSRALGARQLSCARRATLARKIGTPRPEIGSLMPQAVGCRCRKQSLNGKTKALSIAGIKCTNNTPSTSNQLSRAENSLRASSKGSQNLSVWNPFHCCPHKWAWQPEESDIEKIPNGKRHYWIITTALVRAERQIDEFVFNRDCLLRWDGISPNFVVPNALGIDIAALSGIKRLHLLLASCRDAEAPEYCDKIGGLPQLLGSMYLLQRLKLDLPNTINDHILDSHNQVFPKVTMWNSLGTLGLFNFSSSATDLLRLLLIQMPRLKSLYLGPTQLVEGCWESVIECLRQCNQFTTLEIESDCLLYHRGEEFLLCDNADITEYIMHGGRHPCLSKDQPSSASEAYMLRIDADLRDRLLEMKSSRTHVPI